MSTQHTRFSQAQLLIAALFSVVLTGEMPTAEGEIEPLEDEFQDVFGAGCHIRSRLADASRTWMPGAPQHYSKGTALCMNLTRTPLMPSAVARAVAEALSEESSQTPEHWLERPRVSLLISRGVAAKVARDFGVDIRFIPACWERSEDLDLAWERCREELVKIRAEMGGVR